MGRKERGRRQSDFSRREFLGRAAGVSGALLTPAFAGGSAGLISPVLAAAGWQNVVKGKERLIVRSLRPEDLETPVTLLNSWLTPNDLFYVRHHSYAPAYAPEVGESIGKSWKVEVDGAVEKPLTISLDELKRLPRATVTVTLECAGNGRAFHDPPVAGIQWEKGAVGTARFTGARLADILKRAGIRASGRFVLFDGADSPVGKMPDFQRNVPLEKALHADTIIAYEMNDQTLPALHGYPLRAVVPGWEGAYAVKWLNRIRVIEQEHDGFFVRTAYRYPNIPVAPGAAVPPENMLPVKGLVVKSLINHPAEGASFPVGKVRVSGFAWAGEIGIRQVDLSLDQGSTWVPARLGKEKVRYAWQSFEHEFNITTPGSYLVMARATDEQGRMQPVAPNWNPSGYLWNVIDRVRINVNTK
ncbi:MAG: sulfite oxidase-like oxidoreductase [Acidobacteria bacterium]|nr:sulfite oxidase-like oxidoreductase [Acidobacteriota bacterium]